MSQKPSNDLSPPPSPEEAARAERLALHNATRFLALALVKGSELTPDEAKRVTAAKETMNQWRTRMSASPPPDTQQIVEGLRAEVNKYSRDILKNRLVEGDVPKLLERIKAGLKTQGVPKQEAVLLSKLIEEAASSQPACEYDEKVQQEAARLTSTAQWREIITLRSNGKPPLPRAR